MALQATDGDENRSGVRPSGLPPGFCPARRAKARRQPRRAGPTWTFFTGRPSSCGSGPLGRGEDQSANEYTGVTAYQTDCDDERRNGEVDGRPRGSPNPSHGRYGQPDQERPLPGTRRMPTAQQKRAEQDEEDLYSGVVTMQLQARQKGNRDRAEHVGCGRQELSHDASLHLFTFFCKVLLQEVSRADAPSLPPSDFLGRAWPPRRGAVRAGKTPPPPERPQ